MTSQKLENLLNLALNSAEDEREKSLNLNVGYDPLDREWDLIIKYSVNQARARPPPPPPPAHREFRKLNM